MKSMKDSTYWKVMYIVLGLGLVATLAHFGYAIYAYEHGSIIQFIGKELW